MEKKIETCLKAKLDQNFPELVTKADFTVTTRTINNRIHQLVVHPNLKTRVEQLESVFLATMMGDEDSTARRPVEKVHIKDNRERQREEEAPTQNGENIKNSLSPIRITLFAHNSPETEGDLRSKRKFSACSKSGKLFTSNTTQSRNNKQPIIGAPKTVKNPYAKK
jgi:hypothetical protein